MPLQWHNYIRQSLEEDAGKRCSECDLPPNSARISYATEGAFFFSAKLSTNAVNALRKVWVLIRRWKQHNVQQSLGEIKRREVSWTLMKKLDAFAGPGEIKRREVVLDPQVSPEEIKSKEVELELKVGLLLFHLFPNEIMRCKIRPELAVDAQQTV